MLYRSCQSNNLETEYIYLALNNKLRQKICDFVNIYIQDYV